MQLSEKSRYTVNRVKNSAIVTFVLTALLWVIEALDVVTRHALDRLMALRSWDVGDVWAIFTAPFAHYGWQHLIGNTSLILPLAFILALSGARVFFQSTLIVMVISGLFAWTLSTHAATAGFSGVIFGWLTFLIVRGIWSRNPLEIIVGISLLTVYGYVLWGVFPHQPGVSWQGHLGGAIGGILAAWILSKRQPTRAAIR